MSDLTILGLAISAVGICLFLASIRAARKIAPDVPGLPRIEVRDDLKNLPPGSVVTVSYEGFLNKEQRAALKQSIEYQVGQGVKVIVLEGGLRIDVKTTDAYGSTEIKRRRDDTRAPGEVSQWEDKP